MVVLGIDIGGAQIRAGMVDESGAILASRTIETPADLDTFLPSLHDAIRWLLEATSLPGRRRDWLQGHHQPRQHADRNVARGAAFSRRTAAGRPGRAAARRSGVRRQRGAGSAGGGDGMGRGARSAECRDADAGGGRRGRGDGRRPPAARTYRSGRASGAYHGGSRWRGVLVRESRVPGDGFLGAGDRRRGVVGGSPRVCLEPDPAVPRAAATRDVPHGIPGGERRRRTGAARLSRRRPTNSRRRSPVCCTSSTPRS